MDSVALRLRGKRIDVVRMAMLAGVHARRFFPVVGIGRVMIGAGRVFDHRLTGTGHRLGRHAAQQPHCQQQRQQTGPEHSGEAADHVYWLFLGYRYRQETGRELLW